MTRGFEFYHGLVLSRVVHSLDREVGIARFPAASNSCYVIDQTIGLYIKYCTKRLTPWQFTFRKKHQVELEKMKTKLGSVFVVLVCNEDGLVCLDHPELMHLIENDRESLGWVSVGRRVRQMYAVKGSKGPLDYKISAGAFPQKLFTYGRE